jgi:hypothetical protein
MSERGIYRGIYTVLFEDPDFLSLSPRARHVLLTARLCRAAGPGAIYRWYPDALSRETGWPRPQVLAAMKELQSRGWIEYDHAVLWVRNGLRYDPSFRLSDDKHRKFVSRMLLGLPRSPVVLKFCEYYDLPSPFEGSSETLGRPFPPPGIHIAPPETETETEDWGSSKGLGRPSGDPSKTARPSPGPDTPSRNGPDPFGRAAWGTPEALAALYNASSPPNVMAVEPPLGPGRRALLRAALKLHPDRPFWEAVMDEYRRSAFLSGQVPAPPGRGPFRPDLDWLCGKDKHGAENASRVFEGAYR